MGCCEVWLGRIDKLSPVMGNRFPVGHDFPTDQIGSIGTTELGKGLNSMSQEEEDAAQLKLGPGKQNIHSDVLMKIDRFQRGPMLAQF